MSRGRALRRTISLVASVALAGLLGGCQLVSGLVSAREEAESGQAGTPALPSGPRVTFEQTRARDPQAALGAREHPKIVRAFGGAMRVPGLEDVLALVAGRLVEANAEADRAFEVTVLDSPTVNAFALPGGYLYVTRGLLALASDASEVAAVLAHEMAHVTANHGVLRGRQAKGKEIADKVASEVVSNPVVGAVAKAQGERRMERFSQTQELQADALGIRLLGKAGFDPFAAARFLEAMARYRAWHGEGGDDMSTTHPSTPRRVELARRHARAIGPPGTGERLAERYLKGVDGLLFGDREKEGFVRGRVYAHKPLSIRWEAPEGFRLRNQPEAVLAPGPDERALRFDAVPERGNGAPVDYLRSGWVNGLEDASVRGAVVAGLPAARARAQAGDWRFSIAVIAKGGRLFRMILAAPRAASQAAEMDALLDGVLASFRVLSKAQAARLKPLQVDLVTVAPGDSVARLARRMADVGDAGALLRALNGLEADEEPAAGSIVKIVR